MRSYIYSTQHREWVRINSNYDNHLTYTDRQKGIRQLKREEIDTLMRGVK